MKRARWRLIWAVILALGLISWSHAPALAKKGSSGTDVNQLTKDLEKLIKKVEHSHLACETRNAAVRRLRKLHDALLSGNLSGAQALATAWRRHAWSQQAARLIHPELGSSLRTELGTMLGQIPISTPIALATWPDRPGKAKRWKPLPACDSGGTSVGVAGLAAATAVGGSYEPFDSEDVLIVLKTALMFFPEVGHLLAGIAEIFWPSSGTAEISDLIDAKLDEYTKNQAGDALKGLNSTLYTFNDTLDGWKTDCANKRLDIDPCKTSTALLWGSWDSMNQNFAGYRMQFQTSDSDNQLMLLPLFAQYQTLYMSFLREGVLLAPSWTAAGVSQSLVAIPAQRMAEDLDPSFVDPHTSLVNPDTKEKKPDRGIAYVNMIYKMGLDQQPSGSKMGGWNTRNAYIRAQTLQVLDFRDTWKYMDPQAYPGGVPGGVKLTRMIYSDIVGPPYEDTNMPNLPANVSGPLKEISAWTKRSVPGANEGTRRRLVIGSLQATNPPLLGPAQSGAITGDTAQEPNHAHYYSLSALGPIAQVKAQDCPVANASTIGFVWALDGSESWQGEWDSDCGWRGDFAYGGEVLATAQVINRHYISAKDVGYVADAFVFGFRYADSFLPAGQVIGVYSGWCLDLNLSMWTDGTQAVMRPCYQPPRPAQIWTYDPGLQQISVTNPAEWSDTNPTNSGKHCLDTAGGGTAAHTPVVINACDDGALTYDTNGSPVVSSQRWTIESVGAGIGKITNVKSGMVLDVYSSNGALMLQLYPYHGHPAQQWHAHAPLTGEIHGIGSGRCVDVPDASTTLGSQVQIYDCNGTAAQQWTYDPASKKLIYAKAPSLCLEARGGGTTSGTAVQINTCTGAAEQKWTLQGDGGVITNVKSGLVLDVKGGNTGNKTPVQLYASNGTQAQQWSRTSTQGGALHTVGGKCLDLPVWDDYPSNSPVWFNACTSPSSAAQTWTYHPVAQTFTVNTPSGPKCLDAAYGGTTAGDPAVINNCTGAASQRWERDFGNSTIINVNSGLVLDANGGTTADPWPVQLTPQPVDAQGHLLPPTSSQQWVWSLD